MKLSLLLLSIGFCVFIKAQTPTLVIPLGHEAPISKILASPDEKKLLSFEELNCYIWDVSTGKLLFVLGGHTDAIKNAAFSADGKLIATSSYDRTVKVWESNTGKMLYDLKGHTDIVHGVAFSSNNKQLVTCGDKTVKVWDLSTGTIIKTLTIHKSYVTAVAYSLDGKYILSGSDDSTICVTDAITLETVRYLKGHHYYIGKLIPSANNKLISIDLNGQCIVWDINSGKQLLNINNHDEFINAAFLDRDNILVAGTGSSKLIKYNIPNGKKIFSCQTDLPFDSTTAVKYQTGIKIIFPVGIKNELIAVNGYNDSLELLNTSTKKIEHVIKQEEPVSFSMYLPKSDQIITAGTMMKIWNPTIGYELITIQNHAVAISPAGFSNTNAKMAFTIAGKYFQCSSLTHEGEFIEGKILTASKDESLRIMANNDTVLFYKDKSLVKLMVPKPGKEIWNAEISPGEKYALIRYNLESPVMVDLNSYEAKVLHQRLADKGTFSNDDSILIVYGINDSLTGRNSKTGDPVFTYTNKSLISFSSVAISSDKQYVSFCASPRIGYIDTLFILRINDMHVLHRIPLKSNYNFILKWSNDNKYVILSPMQGYLQCYELASGKMLYELDGLLVNKLSNNNIPIIASAYSNADLFLYDIATGQKIRTLSGHKSIVTEAFFDTLNNRIITGSADKSVKFWDMHSGELKYSVFALDSSLVTVTADGFFKAQQGASKNLHYVTSDAKVITFDQLDVQFNRPDKVLQSLNNKDTSLIKSYRQAFLKRVKKLGIDTTSLNNSYQVPGVVITNKQAITYDQTSGEIKINVSCNDKQYNLIRFNIYVNEVPVFGTAGINISQRQLKNFDTSVSVRLSSGLNRIEVSVFNSAGRESYRSPLLVRYTSAKEAENKMHFIGIALNKYQDSTYNLNWSVKDIRDLCLKLKSKYPSMVIDTLFNEHVTKEAVLHLKEKLKYLGEDDRLIVAYSGHGLLSKQLDYYLSTYDINFNDPSERGLPYESLEGLLDGIRPRKKLMLLDACHSGEVDKDDIEKIQTAKGTLDSLGTKTKSSIKIIGKSRMGLTNSFELMQTLFANVSRGTGATIISAAGGMQFAQERGDIKNGVFTFCVIDAMNRNSTLTVSALKKIVFDGVVNLTGGLQRPTSRTETSSFDWVVW